MRSEEEVRGAIEKYGDMVLRLCMVYLKNRADTEDIFQEVFFKYCTYNKEFMNDEHKKAWFIRVTVNACKDLLRSFFHRNALSLEEYGDIAVIDKGQSEVFEALFKLPERNRSIVYLYYYEGYKAEEIAGMLSLNVNTVYTLLSRSKKLLKGILKDE